MRYQGPFIFKWTLSRTHPLVWNVHVVKGWRDNAFATDGHSHGRQKLWQKQIPWEGRTTWVGATSSIIVANRAWIMTRERTPGTINLGGTTWPTDNGSRRGVTASRGPVFSFPPHLGDGDVRHCAIRRGPLSTSVPRCIRGAELRP